MNRAADAKVINNLVILMAMQAEAELIIQSLQLIETKRVINPQLPMRCFQKHIGNIHLSLMVSGIDHRYQVDNIGSEAATLMTYEAITQLKPDLIISAGTAGGFSKRGASVGTVYLSEQHFVYHDRHVPLEGFEQSAIGKYPAAKISRMAKDLSLPCGVISSGSSLQKNAADIAIIEQHQAVAKEMEAAAIAWVAMLFKIPMFAIKSITNVLDENNQSEQEFVKNLAAASQSLHQKVIQIINYLQNKTLLDLQ